MDIGVAVQGIRQAQQEFCIAAAAPFTAHGDRGFATGNDDTRFAERLPTPCDLACQRRMRQSDIACFAFHFVGQDIRCQTGSDSGSSGSFQSVLRGGDYIVLVTFQPRIAGLGGFARAGFEMLANGFRRVDIVFAQHCQGFGTSGRIRQGWSTGDDAGIVARDIGNHQCHDSRRSAGQRQPAAFDGGQMLAHAIHFKNIGAAFQQGFVDGLLLFEGNAFGRQCQQGRAAAGNQAQHQIVCSQALDQFQHAGRRFAPRFIRHRMRSLNHFDPFAVGAVGVTRHHQTGDLALPMILYRFGHRCCAFTGADHQGASLARRRRDLGQVFWQAFGSADGVDRGLVHVEEKLARFDAVGGSHAVYLDICACLIDRCSGVSLKILVFIRVLPMRFNFVKR